MKSSSLFLCVLTLTALISASCGASFGSLSSSELKDQVISPIGSGSIKLYGASKAVDPQQQDHQSGVLNSKKVDLPDDFLVQAIFDMNLDLDTAVEQIVAYKTAAGSEDLINLGIVDYDETRSTWILAQSLPTLAINIRTFSLRSIDLTRDNIQELVASGLDAKGNQTLDVFKLSTSPEQSPLQYTPVLNITADISIEVRRKAQPESDSNPNDTGAPSYSINVQNKSVINSTDLSEDMYDWSEAKKNFSLSSSHTIPGAQMQEEQLKDLQNASIQDFEKFISGAWYRTLKDRRGQVSTQILFFEPEARSFRLIEGDRMESHIWKTSTHPNLGTRLQIYLENESLHTIRSMATVIPSSSTELTFYLQDKDEWSGAFQRLSAEQEQEMKLGRNSSGISINPLTLNGLFKSETGGEIVFAAPWFTWRQGEKQKRGGYLTYQLAKSIILELQSISDKGLVEDKEYYIITALPSGPKEALLYELRAANVNINGASPKGNEVMRIIQVSTETN